MFLARGHIHAAPNSPNSRTRNKYQLGIYLLSREEPILFKKEKSFSIVCSVTMKFHILIPKKKTKTRKKNFLVKINLNRV